MKRFGKGVMLAVAAGVLAACGGTGQDEGTVNSATPANITGAALDGPIAGGLVFIDFNGDGVRDVFEPSALTDSNGDFGVSAEGVDYCADDATAEQELYCLETTQNVTDVAICTVGGYDIITLQPFEGRLCRTVDVVAGSTVSTLMTPLTTLVDSVVPANRQTILDSLGISEADLDVDYINGLESTDGDTLADAVGLFKKAQQVVKTTIILHDRLVDTYDEIGDNDDLPQDVLDVVISALGEVILENANESGETPDFEQILTDTEDLAEVLQKAEDEIVTIYDNQNANSDSDDQITLPSRITANSDGSDSGDAATTNSIVNVAADVAQITDEAIVEEDITADSDPNAAAEGAARAVEVVVQKSTGAETSSELAAAESEIDAINNDDGFVDSMADTLRADNVDLDVLVERDLSTTDETSDLSGVELSDTADQFLVISGTALRVNDPDNSAANPDKHARIELYFDQVEGATTGSLTACIKYIELDRARYAGSIDVNALTGSAANDDDLVSGDTRGTFAEGNWELLDEGFSMWIRLEVSSVLSEESILKSIGVADGDTSGAERFRFDFDDDLETWLSVSGVAELEGTRPTNNEQCRTRFVDFPDSGLNGS